MLSSCRVRSALLRSNKLNSKSEISTDSSITVAVSPASSAFKLWSLSLCLGLYVQIFSQTFLAGPQLGSCHSQPLSRHHAVSDRVQDDDTTLMTTFQSPSVWHSTTPCTTLEARINSAWSTRFCQQDLVNIWIKSTLFNWILIFTATHSLDNDYSQLSNTSMTDWLALTLRESLVLDTNTHNITTFISYWQD